MSWRSTKNRRRTTSASQNGIAAPRISWTCISGASDRELDRARSIELAIAWAWIGFSWFASAYDTDDWLLRLMTMVQMVACCARVVGVLAQLGE